MTPIPRFCSACGAPLVERVLAADERPRQVCGACGVVAYRNPRIVVSTVVAAGGRVLLCRRAQAPAVGYWALPGGFMECDESLEEAAARETREETGVVIEPRDLRLHAVSTLPDIAEVYVGFRVELDRQPATTFSAECSDARFFAEGEVPWSELAYPEIGNYLRVFFAERQSGDFAIHLSRLDPAGVDGNSYHIARIDDVHIVRPPGWGRRD
jgi:ADP-ribose pyrophosphatase YjhB (NUDIX family)